MEKLSDYRKLGKAIPFDISGKRIDLYLAESFLFLSRQNWCQKIKDHEVLVNELPVKPSYRLKTDDHISYFFPEDHEPEVNKNIEVLWQDKGIIACYKPPNIPMHEGGMYRLNTFLNVLQEKLGPEWAPVHRLDRETSGVVVCANTPQMRNALSIQFRERSMQKKYFALVNGIPDKESWVESSPIGDHPETSFRLKQWVNFVNGAPSITHFRLKESSNGYSFFEVSPKTGRTHQIRVHAAYKGHHLIGDKKYHPNENVYNHYMEKGYTYETAQAVLFDRLCLHAHSIQFQHPVNHKTIEIACPLPKDMEIIWRKITQIHSL